MRSDTLRTRFANGVLSFSPSPLRRASSKARRRVLPQQVVVREKFSQFGVAQPVFDDGAEHFGFFKVFARELGKRVELVECLPERLSMFRAVRQIEIRGSLAS